MFNNNNNNNSSSNNLFGNNNRGNNLFNNQGGTQTQQGNNIFGNNNNNNNSGGNNNTTGGGIFSNNNNNRTSGGLFSNNNNNTNTNTNTGNNIFNNQANNNNNNQGNTSNIFGNNNNTGGGTNNYYGGNIFNNSAQQGGNTNNIFSNNNQQQQVGGGSGGNNIFSNNNGQQQQQGGNNIFSNNQQQGGGNNIFSNQQQQGEQQNILNMSINSTETDKVRFQIEQYSKKIDLRNLDHIRVDDMNMFKDKKISEMPDNIKNAIIIVMNNMKEINEAIEKIKKQNEQLDRKSAEYVKNVHDKLGKYKECLLQNISQSNMLEDIRDQLSDIDGHIRSFLIPLYNAHKEGKHYPFQCPDQFNMKITKKIMEKMIELDKKADEMISCVQGDGMSEDQLNTLEVLEGLLGYYENVGVKVQQFSKKYNILKKQKIQQSRSSSSYQDVMRRIQDKVDAKLKKDFKGYELMNEVEAILQKRQKRQEEQMQEQLRARRQNSYY